MSEAHHAPFTIEDSEITQLLNGLAIVPTLHALVACGAASELLAAPPSADLEWLAARVRGGRAAGALSGLLRVAALHDWLEMEGSGPGTRLAVRPAGRFALELAGSAAADLALATRAMRTTRSLRHLVRGIPAPEASLDDYREVAARARMRWPFAEPEPAARRISRWLRCYLDGTVLCPTLVALAIPVFVEEGDRIAVASPALVDDPASAGDDPLGFRAAAFEALEGFGLAARRQGGEWQLTPRGELARRDAAAHGMMVSYLETLSRFDALLADVPAAAPRARDQGVDRVVNVWGSGGNPVLQAFRREIAAGILRPLFDAPDLDAQPLGIADFGCGSGEPLRAMAEFVLRDTRRGEHLATHPLAVIGSDLSPIACGRARATLAPLAVRPGVNVAVVAGDVGDPTRFATAVAALGLPAGAAGGIVRAERLLHTQMFLAHDRELTIRSPAEALRLLEERVERANPWALADALARLLGRRPKDTTSSALAKLVASQFTTDCSVGGELVPAYVAAADLVDFTLRWAPFTRSGLVLLEPHVPRLSEVREESPLDEREMARADVDPAPGIWGVHFATDQFLMPQREHELALVLGGLQPLRVSATGTGGVSLALWIPEDVVYTTGSSGLAER